MIGKCALSGAECELQISHIYPKFVVKYLRETANNGRFRSFQNVNIPFQDGLKIQLLGREAEQKFSVAETWFANQFFRPVVEGTKTKFSYDDHLYKFAVSLLWRALKIELTKGQYGQKEYYGRMLECEKQWRSFLLNGYIPYDFSQINMLVIQPGFLHMPWLKRSQYYLLRDLDLTLIEGDAGWMYVYVKLPRFAFWAPLVDSVGGVANLIDMRGGYLDITGFPDDQRLITFFPNRIREINELVEQISDHQHEKIVQQILKDRDGFLNSEAGQLFDSQA